MEHDLIGAQAQLDTRPFGASTGIGAKASSSFATMPRTASRTATERWGWGERTSTGTSPMTSARLPLPSIWRTARRAGADHSASRGSSSTPTAVSTIRRSSCRSQTASLCPAMSVSIERDGGAHLELLRALSRRHRPCRRQRHCRGKAAGLDRDSQLHASLEKRPPAMACRRALGQGSAACAAAAPGVAAPTRNRGRRQRAL